MSETKTPKTEAKKKQHYVPQFYLRKFADKFGGLFVFDKASKKAFKSNVRDVGNEKYFYNLPQEQGKSLHVRNAEGEEVDPELLSRIWKGLQLDPEALKKAGPEVIENVLSEIETGFREAFDDLLYVIDKTESFEPEHKQSLAPFLALQLLRTADYRKDLADIWGTIIGDVLRIMHIMEGSPEETGFSVSFDEEALPLYHAWFMLHPDTRQKFASVLYHHIWTVKVNRTEQPFFTSDTPIVKHSHFQEPGQSFGIGSLGVEIIFPLTPKYVLSLYDRSVFHHLEHLDCKHKDLLPEHVMFYNSLQVIHSNRQIYCPADSFDLAKQMCEKEPDVYNPDRKRWKSSTY